MSYNVIQYTMCLQPGISYNYNVLSYTITGSPCNVICHVSTTDDDTWYIILH
jgi:hypothetical protein